MDPNPEIDPPVNPQKTTPAASPLRVCVLCRHYRFRAAAQLFARSELQTPGGLKAYGEWQQQEKQHAERESQLVRDRQAFTYEPHHYAWCAAFTQLALVEKANAGDLENFTELMRTRSATVHPVTGKISAIYALCLWKNEQGDCEAYDPR